MKELILSLLLGATSQAAIIELANPHQFIPQKLTIEVGEEVEFKNVSVRTHTVTADTALVQDPSHVILPEGAQPFHSEPIGPGESYKKKFDVAGLYQFVCLPHEMFGMIGQIEVVKTF